MFKKLHTMSLKFFLWTKNLFSKINELPVWVFILRKLVSLDEAGLGFLKFDTLDQWSFIVSGWFCQPNIITGTITVYILPLFYIVITWRYISWYLFLGHL